MDRRNAVMALGVGLIGILSGKAESGESKPPVTAKALTWWEPEPMRIIWKMDDTEVIELQMGDEKIEINTSEIFEALKEGR